MADFTTILACEIEIGDVLDRGDQGEARVEGWFIGARGEVRIQIAGRWIERYSNERLRVRRGA